MRKLREIRKAAGITIVELSKVTGISQATISSYELGVIAVPKETEELLLRTVEKIVGKRRRSDL